MVKHYSEQLDRTFFAISDPTRRAIIGSLADKGACSVQELAEPFNISLAAISKHLKLLEAAGLIERERKGRVHMLRLSAEPMAEANKWLNTYSQFWNRQLDALEKFLERTASEENKKDDQSK